MKYEDLIEDIKKLEGLKLNSIKPGAEISVERINLEESRIYIRTVNGSSRTRPLSEIKLIWEHLCINSAVHVDEVLSGSGSSRNQPETILVNLPYIEWFKFNQKKHIAFTGQTTHPYGTLKQMDEAHAEEIREILRGEANNVELAMVIVVANDISKASQNLENSIGIPVEPIKQGIYKINNNNTRILLVSANTIVPKITPGTYAVVKGTSVPNGSICVNIDDQTLYAICSGGAQLMVKV